MEDNESPVRSKNGLLRLLISESWTDGSLVSLKEDVISGLTLAVTQVAPSIGFALIAGGPPLYGLFSSFFLGVFSCVLGGRPGQITAIAGAVVVLFPKLIKNHGYDAVCVVSVLTGALLMLLGALRVSRYITLLPSTVMVGFCNGLAVSMVIHQISAFQDEFGDYVVGKEALYVSILCVITFAVMMLLPLFTTILPSTFVAIIVGTAINYIFRMQTTTIGDMYKLQGSFPKPKIPDVEWSDKAFWGDAIQCTFITFIVTSVESFMSDYKIQQLTEVETRYDRECYGLGAAFIINGFFQGMPGCVVFGPSILNIENGTGTRRLSSFICAVLMGIIPVALYSVIRFLPMAVLSGVVFGVSSKTADWRMFAMILLQRISFQEAIVALTVTVVTAVTNLAIATGAGFGAALLFFMWNMSRGRVTMLPNNLQYIDHHQAEEALRDLETQLPDHSTAKISIVNSFVDEDEPVASQNDSPPVVATDLTPSTDKYEENSIFKGGFRAPNVSAASIGSFSTNRSHIPGTEREIELLIPYSNNLDQNLGGTSGSLFSPSELFEANRLESKPKNVGEGKVDALKDAVVEISALSTPSIETVEVAPGAGASETNDEVLLCPHDINPVPNNSLALGHFKVNVNFLDIENDHIFPQVKVLRVKLSGVLFFGSCADFEQNMMRMLHQFHSQLFLRVTDFIFDFQAGLMPIIDYSAAEALQMAAQTLHKRGIRVHLQNMDPRSEVCVERARRYFPHLRESKVDNAKHVVYARRVFNDGMVGYSSAVGDHVLDENYFLKPSSSTNVREVEFSGSEIALPFESTVKIAFPIFLPQFRITVPIFQTITEWNSLAKATKNGNGPPFPLLPYIARGITSAKPFDRRLGDIGKIWRIRLLNKDFPTHSSMQEEWISSSLPRPKPRQFIQVERFPGKGYMKKEKFSRAEWAMIVQSVHRLWGDMNSVKPRSWVEDKIRVAVDLYIDGFF